MNEHSKDQLLRTINNARVVTSTTECAKIT